MARQTTNSSKQRADWSIERASNQVQTTLSSSRSAWSSISSCVYCILAPSRLPFGSPLGSLGSPSRHVGGAVELLGHPLGPKWSQKHQDEGLKIDLGSSRGSQGVSEGLNGSILGRCSSLVLCYLVCWCVFLYEMFCASWLQRRIAVAFLNVLDVVKAAPQARPKTT